MEKVIIRRIMKMHDIAANEDHNVAVRIRAAKAITHFQQALDAFQKGENEAEFLHFLLGRKV